jgi:hypothetical protein
MPLDQVICRSDHDYIGYPLAFYWQQQRLEVDEILSEAHTPDGYAFTVRNVVLGIFELEYHQESDLWSVSHL